MIIFSYDCAIKNLGFCCIEFDENWRKKAAKLISRLQKIYTDVDQLSKAEFIEKALSITKDIDNLLSNIFKLRFANIIDLIPGQKLKKVKYSDIFKRLKYIVECLNRQLPKPDVVLIETQMSVNDKARGISRYIEDTYSSVEMPSGEITFALTSYPIIPIEIKQSTSDHVNTKVYCINATIKNTYSIDKSVEGSYEAFISKTSNYTANKKHTTHNFKYYMEKSEQSNKIENVPNKLDDVADAFMMAYGWLCHNNYIDGDQGIPLCR